MMLEILMTVNLLLALAQTFYLGMKWEQHRRSYSKDAESDSKNQNGLQP